RQIPDHPLVTQTMYDCLHEAMDIAGFETILQNLESGSIHMHSVDTASPSAVSHEILNARPYAFLDDAPLEERRSRAVRTDLSALYENDAMPGEEIIERVRQESLRNPRSPAEMYDLLTTLGMADASVINEI